MTNCFTRIAGALCGRPRTAGASSAESSAVSASQPAPSRRLNGPAGIEAAPRRLLAGAAAEGEAVRPLKLADFWKAPRGLANAAAVAAAGGEAKRPLKLTDLPPEVVGEIASRLSREDTHNLVRTNKSIHRAFFTSCLVRDEVMRLGAGIAGRSRREQSQAMDNFINMSEAMGSGLTALHKELLETAKGQGSDGLWNREAALVAGATRAEPAGAAHREVQEGDSVHAVMARHGLTTMYSRQTLELAAMGRPDGAATVASGQERVDQAADRLGVTTTQGRFQLERAVIDGWGGDAVRNGMSVDAVIEKSGISNPMGRMQLEFVAIGNGSVEMPYGPAVAAVHGRRPLAEVASRYGIRNPSSIQLLRYAWRQYAR